MVSLLVPIKRCTRCKISKAETDFYCIKGKLQFRCKTCARAYQSDFSKRKWKEDPIFRERIRLNHRLCKLRSGKVKHPHLTEGEIRQRIADLAHGIIHPAPPSYQKPKPVKPPKPPSKPKVSPDTKRRNLLILAANLLRGEQKKQARAEKKELLDAWEKKWGFLRMGSKRKKRHRERRKEQIRHSKAAHDPALIRQIEIISYGPCICFWCDKRLESGGTVDHIIPLAKGGSHTSDNICAACSACNSAKRDLSPKEAGLTPCLL